MELLVHLDKFPMICRICLRSDEPLLKFVEFNVLNLYTLLTEIKIHPNDLLPQVVCSSCMDFCNSIENFVEKCKSSDKLLHEALQKISDNKNNLDSSIERVDVCFSHTSYLDKENEDTCDRETPEHEINSESQGNKCSDSHDTKNSRESLTCGSCGVKCFNRKELKKHHIQNRNCKENEFKCSICSKVFSKRHKLHAHLRCHTKEAPFQCKICSKRFRFSQNLRRHNKAHEGIKPFVCHICNKAFSRSLLKEEHLRTHTGETPFICKYCGKGFKRYNSHFIHLTRHKIQNGEMSSDQLEIYKQMECNKCDKKFCSKSALRAHEIIHTGERMFLCNDCGKNFYTRGGLQSHYKVHSGVKPYQCQQCEKSFSQKGGLKNHILTHMGVKPYICEICSKSFVQSTHLKNHMRTHSGERPYVCSYCSKSFALNCNLKVHIRTHTGETPYHCPLCNSGFYDSSSMKKHKKGHEKEANASK